MSQKETKEKTVDPALLSELANRTSNVETITILRRFLATVHVSGEQANAEMHRCFSWLKGIAQGEQHRINELKDLMPQEYNQAEPPTGQEGVSVGAIELEKGEPVFERV